MTVASISSYQAVVDRLPGKRALVFGCFRNMGMTLKDLSEALPNMVYSSVSGRVSDLADLGLIMDSGLTRDGQTVWVKTPPGEVNAVAERRRAARRIEADISGVKGVVEGRVIEVLVSDEVYEKIKRSKRVRFM